MKCLDKISSKEESMWQTTKEAVTIGLLGGLSMSIILSNTPLYFQIPASLIGVGIGTWAGYNNYSRNNY